MGKTLLLLVVSIVLTGLSAAIGLVNKSKLSDARQASESSAGKATQLQADLTKTKGDLTAASKNLETVSIAKEQAESQLTALTTEATTAKNQAAELSKQISDKETEITTLKADLAKAQEDLAKNNGNTAAPAVEPNQEYLTQIEEQKTLITNLQGKLDSTRGELDVLHVREKDRQMKKLQAGLEGRILAVNQAWNFVVLNLGDRNGMVNNAELLVKRGNRLVGKVRITSVEPSISIADIVANSVAQGVNIAPGDNVIYQASEE